MNIKDLKPNPHSKYKQGYYHAKNPQKYNGDPNKIIFRSSWEQRMMVWLDIHPSVKRWGSEPLKIPYVQPLTNRYANYNIDFYATITKDGVDTTYLIEIKPKAQKLPPPKKLLEGDATAAKLKRYNYMMKAYVVNVAKWKAAEKYAVGRGMRFIVADETFLF